MTKHTEKAGPLPNASIDFDKVQSNAKSGKKDVFAGAVTAERAAVVDKDAQKVLDAAAAVRAEEAEAGVAIDADADATRN